GANSAGELAVWDAGAVLTTHQEFGGRAVVRDGAPSVHYHATHVAGTMAAAGVDPLAHGMSPAAWLDSYDWTDDESEMAAAAAQGLLVSNHSYSFVAGWYYNSAQSAWYWYGDVAVSQTEDPGFGIYSSYSQEWDQVAHDAPFYLIVCAAGNDRANYGPGPGGLHYYWDPGLDDWAQSTATREQDGGTDGFDSIPYRGTCKNVLTVGAILDVPGGWTQPADVVMSSFSSWGPTDDGRIKPDLVANGVGLYSCGTAANNAYASYNGTSMATPNASGSLHLLAQLWSAVHGGQPARSATLKAVAIHTASEAGASPGPDYAYGWGLLDAEAAGLLIAGDLAFPSRITEATLAQGDADTLVIWSNGDGPVTATLVWNDPAGPAQPWTLNPTQLALVNDLDLRIVRASDGQTTQPWTLNPASPGAWAARGDNVRDNVEKVETAAAQAGAYRIIVRHKGTLSGGSQAYTLVAGSPEPPAVSNVTFAQRDDGSGLVDIAYDLADPDSPAVSVTIEASDDGGATWDLAVNSATGHVGSGVAAGAARSAVWNFGADHPGVVLPTVVIRVTADDGP
ncbi:S8 family serine peptidase, partial [bacterium]|nr:S8 family serine peptidase [bacterium]